MKLRKPAGRLSIFMVVTTALAACAAVPQITRLEAQSAPTNTPYENILVVGLFDSFDSRRYYEKETVKALEDLGTKAVALTSQIDLREPVNRDTILPLVKKLGADAVLVTQVSNLRTTAQAQNRRPESTHNIRPTYYYNVFSVELTEYAEPPAVQYNFDLALRADLFSVESKESVWAVASNTKDKSELDGDRDYSKYVNQATAIVRALKQDRLIGK